MSRPEKSKTATVEAPNALAQVAKRYGVSRESSEQLEVYSGLLLKWNSRINLIGPCDAEELWQRHIADALQLLPLIPDRAGTIVDLGSGAGLPGLVVAIARGGAAAGTVHLIEANAKKAAFLREAIRVTGARAAVLHRRIEAEDGQAYLQNVDLVLSRALAPLPKLVEYAKPFVQKGAICLFHKGQDVDVELTQATKYWRINFKKHPSRLSKGGCILEITEIQDV